jgi:predicted nucleotide-binding protein
MSRTVSELEGIREKLHALVESADTAAFVEPIGRLEQSAETVAKAWSGSWLGYHSRVYYKNLQPPPPGAHFSSEWGLMDAFSMGSTGDWEEHDFDKVRETIERKAGKPDLTAVREVVKTAQRLLDDSREEILSILETSLAQRKDSFVERLRDEAREAKAVHASGYVTYFRPKGQLISRDMAAVGQGRQCPPHVAVLADMAALRSPISECRKLDNIAARAATHLQRSERVSSRAEGVGANVFIGHGRSALWKDLKDFIQDRLRLPWDEFNRIPVAGITNIARLSEMLDSAAVAFLVMTAEDELVGGAIQARVNVVHEAGLFQGRLGFTKAIILLEDSCEEFTNIQGLGQIRFPKANIKAAFEEVRQVLKREGLIDT